MNKKINKQLNMTLEIRCYTAIDHKIENILSENKILPYIYHFNVNMNINNIKKNMMDAIIECWKPFININEQQIDSSIINLLIESYLDIKNLHNSTLYNKQTLIQNIQFMSLEQLPDYLHNQSEMIRNYNKNNKKYDLDKLKLGILLLFCHVSNTQIY